MVQFSDSVEQNSDSEGSRPSFEISDQVPHWFQGTLSDWRELSPEEKNNIKQGYLEGQRDPNNRIDQIGGKITKKKNTRKKKKRKTKKTKKRTKKRTKKKTKKRTKKKKI